MKTKNFSSEIESFIQDYYIPQLVEGIRGIGTIQLDELSGKAAKAIRKGNNIFAFGNGGSEAIAEHLVYSLEKRVRGLGNYKYYNCKFSTCTNPKISEATDVPNAELFNGRIRQTGRNGDLAFLVSASGNSDNINNVSQVCRQEGVKTISLSGAGRITYDAKSKADYSVIIPIKDQQIGED